MFYGSVNCKGLLPSTDPSGRRSVAASGTMAQGDGGMCGKGDGPTPQPGPEPHPQLALKTDMVRTPLSTVSKVSIRDKFIFVDSAFGRNIESGYYLHLHVYDRNGDGDV